MLISKGRLRVQTPLDPQWKTLGLPSSECVPGLTGEKFSNMYFNPTNLVSTVMAKITVFFIPQSLFADLVTKEW